MADRMGRLAALDEYEEAAQPYRGFPRLDAGQGGGFRAAGSGVSPQARAVEELLFPQTPLDYALTAFGPLGKLPKAARMATRAGSLALGGILGSDDAEAGGLLKTLKKGIKAYHSSPHDFDKFDVKKIGTGEGAQVYGHGLYFAENPAVSGQGGQYWNQFASRFDKGDPVSVHAMNVIGANRGDRAKAIADMERILRDKPSGYDPERITAVRDFLASGKNYGPRTYEVNIAADPARFLDWDKPLHQQPKVYEKIKGHAGQVKEMGLQDAYKHFLDAAELKGMPGSDFYQIARKHGPEALSQDLRDAGIPGIRYLDEGSRGALNIPALEKQLAEQREMVRFLQATSPDGPRAQLQLDKLSALEARLADARKPPTSNYVIFDPDSPLSKVDILKKYGIVGAPAGALGALAAQDNYEPQREY